MIYLHHLCVFSSIPVCVTGQNVYFLQFWAFLKL